MKIRKKLDEPRNTVLTLRLSQTERKKLGELAESVGVSVGAYLVGLALGDSFVDGSADLSGGKSDPAQVSIGGF